MSSHRHLLHSPSQYQELGNTFREKARIASQQGKETPDERSTSIPSICNQFVIRQRFPFRSRQEQIIQTMTTSISTGLFGDRLTERSIVSSLSREETDQELGADTGSGTKINPSSKNEVEQVLVTRKMTTSPLVVFPIKHSHVYLRILRRNLTNTPVPRPGAPRRMERT